MDMLETDQKVEPTTRLTSAGQVTIPKRYREALQLKPGQLLNVEIEEGRVVFTPMELVRANNPPSGAEEDLA